ncbi:MAG: 2-oxo acid dehydrogenase subunit E2, partial [Firmicutes bacterium]|nr:2-oxo acid dehydrogenase subunit E2 [Bacillota bacterium]
VKKDPNYASAFITNLGSIHLKSGYHHLSNWGTTSLFVIIGERKMKPFFDEKGNVTMKMVNDIGLTIDERIADGFYYAKSVRLLKKLAENPELLELRADEEVEY